MMKLCFVTVGATAPFPKLLDHVFTDSFFGALNASGFTHLMVQYGKDGEKSFIDFLERYPQGSDKLNRYALTIGGFDFEPSLERWFKMTTKSIQPERKLGLVISHAGKINPSPLHWQRQFLPFRMARANGEIRHGFDPGRHARSGSSYHRPEQGLGQQPPGGIGQRAVETGLCPQSLP